MTLTHAYMNGLYQQLAQHHVDIAQLQDEVLRLNKENITLKAEAERQRHLPVYVVPDDESSTSAASAAARNGQQGVSS